MNHLNRLLLFQIAVVFLSIFCHFLKIVPDLYEAVGMITDGGGGGGGEEPQPLPEHCPDPGKVYIGIYRNVGKRVSRKKSFGARFGGFFFAGSK